jgi:hypothetical protein
VITPTATTTWSAEYVALAGGDAPPSASRARRVWTLTPSRTAVETGHEAIEIRDDLILLHETVGIVAAIGIAGQVALPVRRDQAKLSQRSLRQAWPTSCFSRTR